MTELEWRVCKNPEAMWDMLYDDASDRKLRLFAVACCRRFWPLLDELCRELVRVAERFADGLASEEELRAWRVATEQSREENRQLYATSTRADGLRATLGTASCGRYFVGMARDVAQRVVRAQPHYWQRHHEAEVQAALLHNIFGPQPGNHIALAPGLLAWNDCTIPNMASTIYWERAFDHLPILGDALEEAGCTDAEVLEHLRSPGPHVRGCWSLDLVLGRE